MYSQTRRSQPNAADHCIGRGLDCTEPDTPKSQAQHKMKEKHKRNTAPMDCVNCAPVGKRSAHVQRQNEPFLKKWQPWAAVSRTQQLLRQEQIPHTTCMTHVPPTLQLITKKKTWFLNMTTQEMRVHLSAHDNLHVKTKNQHLQNSNLNHSESKNLLCTDENRQHTTLVLDRPPKTKEQKQAPPGGLVHREIGLNGQETSRRSVGTWNIDRPSATQRATSTCVRSNELCPAAPNMILCPTSPSLGCRVLLRGVPSASQPML